MSISEINEIKVLVCQRGARRRYAVPRLLEGAGLLTALYTDSTAYSRMGKFAQFLSKSGMKLSRVRALASRVPAGIPPGKVFCSDRALFASLLGKSDDLSARHQKLGIQGANVVYSMYGEDVRFLEWAKGQGARIIMDVFIHPQNNRIVMKEGMRWASEPKPCMEDIEKQDAHSLRIFKLADLLLCPSEWVAEGVRELSPECACKIRIVPYGSSLKESDSINESPEIGRILFVGREPMRKGLHYLAEASYLARKQGMDLDVRAAGVKPNNINWIPHRKEVRCLGTLPMNQMRREYERADLFVLPSFSEGQAGVILEAMACGCPVIATRESGVDFEPGCGVIIPAGNSQALAEALVDMVGNREKRNVFARGALRQASSFSMERWEERLIDVMREAIRI
ncbi:MAG: glycosyltransferase family 4 protein [Pontiella sp.]